MKTILRLFMFALLVTSFSCEKDEVVLQNEIESAALNATFARGGGCEAYSGTIKPNVDNLCLDGDTFFAATPGGDAFVPSGYETLYGLSVGPSMVIVQTSTEPNFSVDQAGSYSVHTLVYDPNTLNPDNLQLGNTTISNVVNLINNNGLCASLDTVGASINVADCVQPCGAYAGTITPNSPVCLDGSTTITGSTNGDMIVPDGYSVVYGLTTGSNFVIVGISDTPSFTVNSAGTYRIHSLVYATGSIRFQNVTLGRTTRNQVMLYIRNKGLCATFEAAGAPVVVQNCD